jgi:hypothetical protein
MQLPLHSKFGLEGCLPTAGALPLKEDFGVPCWQLSQQQNFISLASGIVDP